MKDVCICATSTLAPLKRILFPLARRNSAGLIIPILFAGMAGLLAWLPYPISAFIFSRSEDPFGRAQPVPNWQNHTTQPQPAAGQLEESEAKPQPAVSQLEESEVKPQPAAAQLEESEVKPQPAGAQLGESEMIPIPTPAQLEESEDRDGEPIAIGDVIEVQLDQKKRWEWYRATLKRMRGDTNEWQVEMENPDLRTTRWFSTMHIRKVSSSADSTFSLDRIRELEEQSQSGGAAKKESPDIVSGPAPPPII